LNLGSTGKKLRTLEGLAMPEDARRERPRLLFLYSRSSGRARRVDGYLANVLQRRKNHHTFALRHVAVEDHPELAERLMVNGVPTLVVVERKLVRARLEDPRGTREIEAFLAPWLRGRRAAA
jgi:thioredoxin-like negative regulator of GroEL